VRSGGQRSAHLLAREAPRAGLERELLVTEPKSMPAELVASAQAAGGSPLVARRS
jgi:hypothetical protein